MFSFVVAPFCSCLVSLVCRFFDVVVPGCAKCFFCCAPLGAATFRRGQSKKNNTTQAVFLLRPRRKAGEGEAPLGARVWPLFARAPRWCFFVFFALAPCRRPTGLLLPLPFAGAGARKKNSQGGVFFCSGPAEKSRRPTGRNNKNNFAHPGTTAKKNLEANDTGHEQKGATTKTKKTTHSLRP